MDGESERRLGKKAGDLLVRLAMMMVSVREMTVMREMDLEIAALPGKNITKFWFSNNLLMKMKVSSEGFSVMTNVS